ncbi:hypothetical protein NIES4071_52010 [Calothrix sp. NIES-4071]|nr:hypothetical protein NIES4071_52010 [Calothrix sp. NIES-4071]BAZ59509.1 hypothetical protein NIES4105_51960 [Calothrix sp. NIES-4105]
MLPCPEPTTTTRAPTHLPRNLIPTMDEKTPPQFVNTSLANTLEQARVAAEDVSTDPELLQELARSQDKATRRAVAANPNTPADTLLRLGAEFPMQLVENPVFSLLLLENPNLVAEIPLPTLRSILKLDNVPLFILEQAANKADVEVQLALANNIQTSKKVLERLTQSRDAQVAESARLHVNFAGELTEGYEEKAREVIQGNMSPAYRAESNSLYCLAILAQICPIPKYIIEYLVQDSSYEYICRSLATSPATLPDVLRQLACHINPIIRYEVARNPRVPTDTKLQLMADCEEIHGLGSVRSALASNPDTPLTILESLAKENYSKVREKVAQNPNTPLSVIQELINDKNGEVACIASEIIKLRQSSYGVFDFSNESVRIANILETYQRPDWDKNWSNRSHAASNPNTPIFLLEELAKDKEEMIRQSVASNPKTPISILEKLAQDDSHHVRYAIAWNIRTPTDIVFKQLARDSWASRGVAARMSSQNYGSTEVNDIEDILAEESASPVEIILQRLIQEGKEAARVYLARRVDLPADLLIQLARSSEYKVREAIAQNPSTPAEGLAYLTDDKQLKIRLALAQSPNTPSVVLEELAEDSENSVRDKAMQNLNLSKDAIERILCGKYANDYLKQNPDFLLQNPNSLILVINHYLNTKSAIVNYIVLLQSQVSKTTLQEKIFSISWLERFAVAQNSTSSLGTIQQLAKDSNQLVRAAAKKSLEKYILNS